MKALILEELGRLGLHDHPEPAKPQAGEVLVRVNIAWGCAAPIFTLLAASSHF